ncbi:ribosome biogenesis urb1 [Trichoderma arundinaceum]|uniref:Ribosome biogenesis urb1 n=1 Tax=Trichoderma arundinaceum TaxID=490622 RepID=A0A395NRD2_TRIAR|nr:ribosome biogenesis urb1 [Trichoderma arundinaceum]
MGKRASIDADGAAAFRKRQKITHDVPTGEDVSSGDQLRSLLAFDQDMRRARHGLQSFKRLLDNIVSGDGDRSANLGILREYLELVKPRHDGEDAVHLSDIMEMWSFAAQVNEGGVMSSVAVVLALVLNVVSDSLELVKYGLGICQSLVQDRQLKSISKNLSSDKTKGFIISPTLRLLREAVSLDGGAFARRIVRARTFTFASLGRNLEIGNTGDSQGDSRKASVRTNAVRFFLSCLKYLHSDGRKELVSQKELLSHLTFMIKSDPPSLVLEILDVLKSHVLADSKIPREVKFKCFNTKTLMRILALYSYSNATETESEADRVSEKAHQFLMYVCTKPGAGILYPSTGLYPKETDEEFSVQLAKRKGSTHDSIAKDDTYRDGVPVYNFVLSEFAAKLRPWSSMKHSQLLTAIFEVAPELIANYFFNNQSFTFEPKLTMTWIGYASFLFDTMRIPLPPSFGDKTRFALGPPPTSVLLDNILPLPLNQKVIIRCLSPNSNLTSFFATRMLIEALEKLSIAVKLHEEAFRATDARWSEASRKLIDAFCRRIPDMKEIVRSYKSIPSENALHKTMASRLLLLYYEVIPQVALAANFDVSPFFVNVLRSLQDEKSDHQHDGFREMELENLVSIAGYSPGMRWFSRIEILSGKGQSSPFTALLKLLSNSDRTAPLYQLKKVLADVAVENQLVSATTKLKPLLQALTLSTEEISAGSMEKVWSYLDNCISRCATSPIKYLDVFESYLADGKGDVQAASGHGSFNLLAVAIAEQLPFIIKSADAEEKVSLSSFISLYFSALYRKRGSDALKSVYHKIEECFSSHSTKLVGLGKRSIPRNIASGSQDTEDDDQEEEEQNSQQKGVGLDEAKLEETLHIPFASPDDTGVLLKWHAKGVEDLIEDGLITSLIRLLSSEHTNIRKEALTNLLKMAVKIDESSYEEKKQVWLLLSELAESSRPQVDGGPVPSAFVAFSVHALDILKNPLHPLYPKINGFLTRSPVWSPEKLPLAHDILHGEPSEDDKYYTEIAWFLTYILDALKTPFDLGIFHKKRWFEKILALGSNPHLRSNLRIRILRIIYRATCIDSGSTTLITRFGLLTWLDAQRAACTASDDADLYKALMDRAWATCDQARVKAWSKEGVEKLLGNMQLQE